MSGGGTNTVQTNSAPPPQFLQAYEQAMQGAQAASQQPWQTPPAPVAPLSSDTQVGIQGVQDALGASYPYIGAAGNYISASNAPLNAGQPYQQQATSDYQRSIANPITGNNVNVGVVQPGTVNPTQFSADQVNQYESPYTQQVVNATQAQFNNQNEQQQQAVVGNAVSSGAWGGDRSAVAQGITAGQQQLAQAPVIAGLENQGYSQALNEFNTQQGIGLGAQEYNTGTNLTAQQSNQSVGLQGEVANQQNQLQAQEANAGLLQSAGAGIGNIGQQALGAQEAQGWLASQGAYAESNLGNQALQNELTQSNAMLGIGSMEQQQQQAEMNSPYYNELAQIAYPFQTSQFYTNAAEGLGGASGGTSSTTSPGPSGLSQAAGLGLSTVGVLGATGAFGSSGWLAPAVAAMFAKRGGGIPHRAGGGIIPGVGAGISGVVDVVPQNPNVSHGMGPPKPPPAQSQQSSGASGLGTQAVGIMKATGAFGDQGWMNPKSDQNMPVPPIPPAGGELGAANDMGTPPQETAHGGAIQHLGIGGGLLRTPHPPAMPHLGGTGIAGAHPFHPPGMPRLAPGGGINLAYPDQTANEVAVQNAAEDQTDTMAAAMAAAGMQTTPQMMAQMVARGGGIARRADGGGLDDDAPPVVITGSPNDQSGLPPEAAPTGIGGGGPPSPPPAAGQGSDAAQVTTSPDDTGHGIAGSGKKPPSNSDIWTTMLAAGLGMMGGTSPFASVNIGRGGLEGMQMGEQIHQREEQTALRQQQQESNNLYRNALIADKGRGRDIQADRAATYAQLSQASASQKMAQAALESARAAMAGNTKITSADIEMQAIKGMIGQPNPDDGGKPFTLATARMAQQGLYIRQQNANTADYRAHSSADLAQQRIDALAGFRDWQMQHGDATLEQTNRKIADAKSKGATDEDLRALGLLRNPVTGELPKGAVDTAHGMSKQLRDANRPAADTEPPAASTTLADPLGIR